MEGARREGQDLGLFLHCLHDLGVAMAFGDVQTGSAFGFAFFEHGMRIDVTPVFVCDLSDY